MNLRTIEDRYRNDGAFYSLVKNMEMMIENLHFTPSEVREAAVYACLMVETRNPRPMNISKDLEDHLRLLAEKRPREKS